MGDINIAAIRQTGQQCGSVEDAQDNLTGCARLPGFLFGYVEDQRMVAYFRDEHPASTSAKGQRRVSLTVSDMHVSGKHRETGVHAMLDASTGHLTERDKDLLGRLADPTHGVDPVGYPRVAEHKHGFVLFVSSSWKDEDAEQMLEHFGAGLTIIMRRAARLGAMLINLDSDGERLDGVPTFD